MVKRKTSSILPWHWLGSGRLMGGAPDGSSPKGCAPHRKGDPPAASGLCWAFFRHIWPLLMGVGAPSAIGLLVRHGRRESGVTLSQGSSPHFRRTSPEANSLSSSIPRKVHRRLCWLHAESGATDLYPLVILDVAMNLQVQGASTFTKEAPSTLPPFLIDFLGPRSTMWLWPHAKRGTLPPMPSNFNVGLEYSSTDMFFEHQPLKTQFLNIEVGVGWMEQKRFNLSIPFF